MPHDGRTQTQQETNAMRSINIGGISRIAFAAVNESTGGNTESNPPESDEDNTESDEDESDLPTFDDVLIGNVMEPELDSDGNVILPDARERRDWNWKALAVGGSLIVAKADAPSARSSANSYGKGTKGKDGKPGREPREFGSQTVMVSDGKGGKVKAVRIFRRS